MEIIKGVSKGYSVQSKKVNKDNAECRELARHIESGKYYDTLDNFDTAVMKINNKAADGEEPKKIQGMFLKLLPAFIILCGGDGSIEKLQSIEEPKKRGPKPKPKTVLQVNLKTMNGWGICPTCGKKCIRVKENTILVNYPMFCKACKRDYVVNWKMPS